MEHRYATVNGIRLHCVSAGSGALIPFLHGFPEFWYARRNQLEEFSRDHRAVAPDRRGYNLRLIREFIGAKLARRTPNRHTMSLRWRRTRSDVADTNA